MKSIRSYTECNSIENFFESQIDAAAPEMTTVSWLIFQEKQLKHYASL